VATTLHELTAAEASALIGAGRISPLELTRAILDRIERLQPVLNAFITLSAERALDEARAAEGAIARGARRGPLHGIPFSVKDLVDTAGLRTTCGSLVYKDNVPAADAVAVARLRAAGAILIGKTTTPEFGHKPLTEDPLFGRTRNAWSAAHTAGGSSGGAAVAVATGLAPLSIATDGGGSTRIPAACNGVVGFKQSLGVVPHSQAPDAFGNYSYVTPMTRTVRDTGLMLEAMAGAHASDPWSFSSTVDFAAAPLPSLKGIRVGFRALLGNARLARDVAAAFERALRALNEAGATVEEIVEPFESTEPIWRVINHATWRARFRPLLAKHRAIMSPTLARQVDEAAAFTAEDFQTAAMARTALFRRLQGWLSRFDLIATPTLARTALPIDHDPFAPIEIDGVACDTVRRAWYPYTLPFNLTGHPAVSLPIGNDAIGLPIGIQLVGRLREDGRLLDLAATVEALASPRPALPAL
jgi:aspartyl-tRNA(Asn)/glutamyl-tRNA(Gln) amidotransferase subunit A